MIMKGSINMSDVRPDSLKRIETSAQAKAYIENEIKNIKAQVGDKKVLLALSGGVDSSVCAALLIKAIGKNLVCVHVNHGLLRKGEPEGLPWWPMAKTQCSQCRGRVQSLVRELDPTCCH